MQKEDSGADYSWARPPVSWLQKNKLTFVCRYLLDDARNRGKALKLPEAKALSAAGIQIVGNFEYATNPSLTFAQGQADARTSQAELVKLGQPAGAVVFSMDRDLYISEIPRVLDYARGAHSVLGDRWDTELRRMVPRTGLYGEFDLIEAAGRAGWHYLWQCYAWSYGKWSNYATCRQIHNGHWPGQYDADLNTAMANDIGGWILGQNTQEPDVNLGDRSEIPSDLVPHFNAAGSKVKVGDDDTINRLLWLGPLRGLEAQREARDAQAAVPLATAARDEAKATRAELGLLAGKVDALTAAVAKLAAGGGVGGSGASAIEVADEIARRIQQ